MTLPHARGEAGSARGITPRRTRLVRAPDLQTYRRALIHLSASGSSDSARSRVVLVPTRGAARLVSSRMAEPLPHVLTRDELYDLLNDRLPDPQPRLTPYARDAMMQSAAREASTSGNPRPGLVAEMLRFYDQLRRQGRHVTRFEELLVDTLSKEADYDRGAERLLAQTRVLVGAFHGYERRVAESGKCDEHVLRTRLLSHLSADPVREIVVTLGDWIADPNGLYLADFDLLSQLPGAETIDILATDRLLATGFQQRVHEWLPGIEEVTSAALGLPGASRRPTLLVPGPDAHVFVVRDREEELVAVARRIAGEARPQESLHATAVVFKRPLPYLYLARTVLGGAHLPYRTFDSLPLAAEPFAAALDLVFEFVESGFTRRSLTALLSSPHFTFEDDGRPIDRARVGLLDRTLSDARYLGGLDRLSDLAATTRDADARSALGVASRLAETLLPLTTPAAASAQLRVVQRFLDSHCAKDDVFAARSLRARTAIREALTLLEQARAVHDDAPVAIPELAADIRRWIEEQTFEPDTSATSGIHLLDDQAARYADFDHIAIVGLVEHEWPERPRRNIFCPQSLLTALGWPSEQDRRGAAEARFLDLLASATLTVSASTITLDDEALVEPSGLVDDIPQARLAAASLPAMGERLVFTEEALSLDLLDIEALDPDVREWASLRLARTPGEAPAFHGSVPGMSGKSGMSPVSVSSLETYLDCPFKFFARYVLKLDEEPDDAEVMDPKAQGAFVHRVFEMFFRRWQAGGHQAITTANIETARVMFGSVVEERLRSLSDTEAALERTRLLGSAAAAGLGEAVLRMEAERPVPVVDRVLEYWMDGDFTFASDAGPRTVSLKGKADRIDLLADGTFRLIDYKLGWPPSDRGRALQLPIYALCAEQRLDGRLGRRWTMGEAAYLAFKGPRRVVPLIGARDDRAAVLARAQQRLVDTIDAIDRGEFPPRPVDVYRCDTCTYAAVCRKDYVGDV